MSLSATFLDRAHLPPTTGADPTRAQSSVEKLFDRLAYPKGTDGQGGFLWDDGFERDFKSLMSSEAQPK
jgi:hypothetical protein